MIMKLEVLRTSDLTNIEFGQLMNRHTNDLATIAPAMLTDAPFNYYVSQITAKSAIYLKALAQVQKNDETDKIAVSDAVRDKAIDAFSKALKLAAASDDPEEIAASKSLGTLFKTFKDLATLNYEAETLGIDKLVSELNGADYADKVDFLNIGKYVTRMDTANQNFKTLFTGRIVTEAMTESYDMKAIRKEMSKLYSDFTTYILAMAKVPEAPPLFSTALNLLNLGRKYYADMLATRIGKKEVKEKANA